VTFNTSLIVEYWPQLRHGMQMTILLWLAGSAIAAVIGFVCGFCAALGPPLLRKIVRCYVEAFRGTPLRVQLFIVYSGGPHVGITLSALTVGISGLGLYGGAYFTETVRGGVLGIPNGQIEAARAFGLTRLQVIHTVILPQMLVLSLPPSVNLLIFLLKDTAVLSILTIPELTFEVTGMTLETFAYVEPFLALAVGYWVLVELTAIAGRFAERSLSRRLGIAL
jgi:polar amino acid transport system permease protein